MSVREEKVKIRDVITVLQKLGFKYKSKNRFHRYYKNEADGMLVNLPLDPDEYLPPRWFYHLMVDIGLGAREFRRILESP